MELPKVATTFIMVFMLFLLGVASIREFALPLMAGMILSLIHICLFPKLAALISIMPQSVLGGAAVMMFSSIVISGIQRCV